jgi:hypothetical protein
MKISTLLLLFTFFAYNSFAQPGPTLDWAQAFGSVKWDFAEAVTVDAMGNVYVTGGFKDSTLFSPNSVLNYALSEGSADIYLAKYSPVGELIWFNQIGGDGADIGHSIVSDNAGSIYITGRYKGTVDFDPGAGVDMHISLGPEDIFVSKYDTAGNFVWARTMGGDFHDRGESIHFDSNGDLVIVGYFANTVDFDPGPAVNNLTSNGIVDYFTLKMSSSGNFIWVRSMGGYLLEHGVSVILDDSDNIYATGSFQGTSDFDPGTAIQNIASNGGWDIFITKLDASGNLIWAKGIGGSGDDRGIDITIDPLGNPCLIGFYSGTVNFSPGGSLILMASPPWSSFILKMDPLGSTTWVRDFNTTANFDAMGIDTDGAGNIYTTANFFGTTDFNPDTSSYNITSNGGQDIFIHKLNASGEFLWVETIGADSAQLGREIAVDAFENIYLTGTFRGTVDFDNDTSDAIHSGNGSLDVFVLKLSQRQTDSSLIHYVEACQEYLSPSGNYLWSSSGIYYDTIPNTAGGDSTMTIQLNVINVDTTVINNGFSLTANATGTLYQWIDCGNGNVPIAGATNQTFSPVINGSYALVITESICTDTSSCYTINSVGIGDRFKEPDLKIYPNPAGDQLTVQFGSIVNEGYAEIFNMPGQIVLSKLIREQEVISLNISKLEVGAYFVRIIDNTHTSRIQKFEKK